MSTENQSEIEFIKIGKLHGYRDFFMEFDEKYKILLSENGQGKTTILKLIDATLTGDLKRLSTIDFETIEVKFRNSDALRFKKDEIDVDTDVKSDSRAFQYLSRKLPTDIFQGTLDIAITIADKDHARRKIKNYLAKNGVTANTAAIYDLVDDSEIWRSTANQDSFFGEIKKNCKYDSLYLPTYRRIEDELSTLGTYQDISLREVIQFGLGDVERKIESMKASTLATSNESMVRINGEILTRLVNGLSVIEEDKAIIQEHSNLIELVLKRVGHTLSDTDKARIVDLVKTGSIFYNSGHDPLIYFLSNLYKAFLDQRLNDEALSAFAKICSSYFTNKTISYDERELVVKIILNETGDEIRFNQLSSGEKQIVSLFSKLYLDSGRPFAILFDEPELSLSVEWQRKIMHDVITSPRCGILIAMTHSPFIFTGLSQFTSDLESYITRTVN